MSDKIKVAIVGLGFGAEFIPIYQRHPDADHQEAAKACSEVGPRHHPDETPLWP